MNPPSQPHSTHDHGPKKAAVYSHATEPRQLAPAALGRRQRSRHMAMKTGAFKTEYFFYFLKDRLFWVIGSVITVVFLSFLWAIKDLPAVPRTPALAEFRRYLEQKQTFFMSDKPAVVEDGQVVEPAEKQYTVPSTLREKSR